MKEMNELNEKRDIYLENLSIKRLEVINDKDLKEIKSKITMQYAVEKEILKAKEELRQFIENEKSELETLSQFLDNKKFSFLSENKTLEEAIEAENETITRAKEQLAKLKAEKDSLYLLIELEIEKTRINMDRELIEAKTKTQNKRANVVKQENNVIEILDKKMCETDEKELLEKELENLIQERTEIDKEIEKLKEKENEIKKSIQIEFEGLNELKQRDLEEIKEEEERIKTLCDNSLKNIEKMLETKTNDIKAHNLELVELDTKIADNNNILSGLLSKVRNVHITLPLQTEP